MKKNILPAVILTVTTIAPAALLTTASPASAQLAVFDATNYSQNLLQAARALQQINQQVHSLQNQATMLQNMAKNLKRIDFPELSQLNQTLQQIGQLMAKAHGIDLKVDSIDQQFEALFPTTINNAAKNDQRVADARSRLQDAMDAFRHSMTVQADVVANVSKDSSLLSDLVNRSQNAEGALQAEQASNQLLALSAKQQLQLQDLIAAQFRSEEIERARQVEAEAQGRAATSRFLGSGTAYPSTRQ